MREWCKKTAKANWFNRVTLGVIIVFSIILIPDVVAMLSATTDKPYVPIIPQPVHDIALLLTCGWFAFEMITRFVADGLAFFRSRRNVFDIIMCVLTAVPYCDWCAMLRLMRNIFNDSIEAPHRDERSGTMR